MVKKVDEFTGQIANEIPVNNERLLYPEAEIYPELKPTPEQIVATESNDRTIKKNDKSTRRSALSTISGSLVTIIAASAFGVTTLINVGMSAEFEMAEFQDGHIAFEINVKDMTDKQTLQLHFKDGSTELDVYDLTEMALDAEDGVVKGQIEFTTDMVNSVNERITEKNTHVTFYLTLTGNVGLSVVRTFDNYAVQFYHAESYFDPENGIEGECHCSEDGYYYFKLNFNDDYGIFYDFHAYIEDGKGNRSDCEDLNDSNAHEQHKISVADMKTSTCKLYVTYKVRGEGGQGGIHEIVMDINL